MNDDTATLLQRARAARTPPVLYWLGHGGPLGRGAVPPHPGRPLDLAAELARLQRERPAVHRAYMAGLAATGLEMSALPTLACDCSGYVCWALGVARDGSPLPGGWINTDAIDADARGAQRLFAPLERAVPGALLVHPKPAGDNGPGHVAIVTEVDAGGRALRMLHCAPGNFMLAPPPGLPRSAIAETDTRLFDAVPTSRLVRWKATAP